MSFGSCLAEKSLLIKRKRTVTEKQQLENKQLEDTGAPGAKMAKTAKTAHAAKPTAQGKIEALQALIDTETHFPILALGVSIWNRWRAAEPLTTPNLRNADLSSLHLESINLCRADLRGATLNNANLYDADFQDADLREANLTRAMLVGANLHNARLCGAMLKNAYLAQSDLSQADFTGAHMQKADFKEALLTKAIFANARIAEADLATSVDLTQPQLNSAKDAHLACFDTALPALLPQKISEKVATAQPAARRSAVGTSKRDKVALQPVAVNRSIDVFQPVAREKRLGQPALRELAVG